MKKEPIRLMGSSLVCVVGMMRNLRTMHNTGDEDLARKWMAAWTDDEEVYQKVVAGDYTVDGDTVIVERDDDEEIRCVQCGCPSEYRLCTNCRQS